MISEVKKSKPWYEEPWPWILMAGPAVVVVAGVITFWLAVVSNDGVVEEDYYKKGLAVNKQIARDEMSGQLKLTADLMLGNNRELRLFLAAAPGVALPEKLVLRVVHPTRAGQDQSIELEKSGGGFYTGILAAPLQGRWQIQVEDLDKQWRLAGIWNIPQEAISLHFPQEADASRDS